MNLTRRQPCAIFVQEPGADDIEPSDTNRPDGDVELDGVDYSTLSLPLCTASGCDGFLKPGVVLFGENVPRPRVQSAMDSVLGSDALLILGTSVQVMTSSPPSPHTAV